MRIIIKHNYVYLLPININMLRTITKYFGSRKKLYFGDDCRRIIQQTTKTVEKVASLTLGPYGRNVAIENEMQAPRITKDGVTVVKHIEFVNDVFSSRKIVWRMQFAPS